MNYPQQSNELTRMLCQDQVEWKAYAKAEYVDKLSVEKLRELKRVLRANTVVRGKRAMRILDEIECEPNLNNIGSEGASALSVLATHYSLKATKRVLNAFTESYKRSIQNTQIVSIPAMTDWVAILELRPQLFGTIWLFDKDNFPFLPAVEDFENINKRRKTYGIEPLRWPKSLAIPEEDQPWLKQPISTARMRSLEKSDIIKLSEYY